MGEEGALAALHSAGAWQARVVLGHSDIVVRPIGLGCMGMSQSYGSADEKESIRTIRRAAHIGVDLFDTSDIYGAGNSSVESGAPRFGHNEELLGRALGQQRDQIVLATKFGATLNPEADVVINGRPEYVKEACDASLRRLGTDWIDLYYYHRLDRGVPIEETVGAMSELVTAGKVRALGLSEMGAETIRRAAAVHPISALQSEYSLWERTIESEVLPACRALGVTLVPFSPLGRAMLTGQIGTDTTLPNGDIRTTIPRFQGNNLDANLRLVSILKAFSSQKGFTAGQVALAWLLAQPCDVVPIPGTRHVSHLEENVAATTVPLSADEVAGLTAAFDPALVMGERYGSAVQMHVDGGS